MHQASNPSRFVVGHTEKCKKGCEVSAKHHTTCEGALLQSLLASSFLTNKTQFVAISCPSSPPTE